MDGWTNERGRTRAKARLLLLLLLLVQSWSELIADSSSAG